VIKEIPEDLSMDEVKKIEEENSNIVISNLFREGAIDLLENLRIQKQYAWKSEARVYQQDYHLEGGVICLSICAVI